MLHAHQQKLPYAVSDAHEKANTPLSEVDPDTLSDWVENQKPTLHEVEGDVRDGKRRVSATKGPRKKAAKVNPVNSDEDDISGDGSGSDVDK